MSTIELDKATILQQIQEVQDEQVLDDAAIAQMPWLVVGANDDGPTEILERFAANAAAVEYAAASAPHWDDVTVISLEALGWQAAAPVTPLRTAGQSATSGSAPSNEDAQDDADADAEPDHVDDDGQGLLLDRSQYDREDLAISKIDGNSVDRVAVAFSGTVMLNRSDPEDVALYNALVLGQTSIALRVTGVCSGTAGRLATAKQGPQDVIVGTKTLLVKTVGRAAGA